VRSLQTREGDNGVQAETKPMPQQEGKVVAETDRTETINKEVKTMGQSFMDRIREHKQTILQGIVVVAIAVVITMVGIMQFAASKDAFNNLVETTTQADAAASAHITSLIKEVGDIQALDLVSSADLIPITDQAAATATNITALGTRVGEAEADIQVHADQLANMHASPPECYLSGNLTAGNLTLHAWASEAGNYTANVHLVFSGISAGNTTQDDAVATFYTSVNWTTANRAYLPTVTFNGTDWHVSQVAFSIGTFALTANNETAMTVLFGGLNYTADFAYADIYKVVK
jgi:hypothetical protein